MNQNMFVGQGKTNWVFIGFFALFAIAVGVGLIMYINDTANQIESLSPQVVQLKKPKTANSVIAAYTYFGLNYSAGANGTVSGALAQSVENGAAGVAVTAVPDRGYRFANWSDGVTDNPRRDINVAADISVTANFAPTKGSWIALDAPGSSWTVPEGVSSNYVVGFYLDTSRIGQGFIYNIATKKWITLEGPEAGSTSPQKIFGNNVVGDFTDDQGIHGFIYNITAKTWIILDAPGAVSDVSGENGNTQATGISSNYVIGYYGANTREEHGFIYNIAAKTWVTLDVPGVATEITPLDIFCNNIVGNYTDAEGDHAFIYDMAAKRWTFPAAPEGAAGVVLDGISGDNALAYYDYGSHWLMYNLASKTWSDVDTPGLGQGIFGNSIVGYFDFNPAGAAADKTELHGYLYSMPGLEPVPVATCNN